MIPMAWVNSFYSQVRWGPPDGLLGGGQQAGGSSSGRSAADYVDRAPEFYFIENLDVQEIQRNSPEELAWRPGWNESYERVRITSLATYQLQDFPYDSHKLKVLLRLSPLLSLSLFLFNGNADLFIPGSYAPGGVSTDCKTLKSDSCWSTPLRCLRACAGPAGRCRCSRASAASRPCKSR